MTIKFNRPKVIGHEAVKKQLKNIIKNNIVSNFLFIGPSGVGKTTLAKILMKHFGIDRGIIEYNAASLSGVDKIRELTALLRNKPIVCNKYGVIIDECHTLSKQAWDALLIDLEVLEDVIWVFCTTENVKIPETVRTRCFEVFLDKLSVNDLYKLLFAHKILENSNIDKKYLKHIAKISNGSARKALMYFYSVKDVNSDDEIGEILKVSKYDDEENLYNFLLDVLNKKIDIKVAI